MKQMMHLLTDSDILENMQEQNGKKSLLEHKYLAVLRAVH